jgi:hypothetical protein
MTALETFAVLLKIGPTANDVSLGYRRLHFEARRPSAGPGWEAASPGRPPSAAVRRPASAAAARTSRRRRCRPCRPCRVGRSRPARPTALTAPRTRRTPTCGQRDSRRDLRANDVDPGPAEGRLSAEPPPQVAALVRSLKRIWSTSDVRSAIPARRRGSRPPPWASGLDNRGRERSRTRGRRPA